VNHTGAPLYGGIETSGLQEVAPYPLQRMIRGLAEPMKMSCFLFIVGLPYHRPNAMAAGQEGLHYVGADETGRAGNTDSIRPWLNHGDLLVWCSAYSPRVRRGIHSIWTDCSLADPD